MQKITVNCPAKINLFLNIIKKEEQYHQMHMINTSISLSDKITIKKINKGIEITCNNKLVPTNEQNSVYKIAALFFEYTNIKPNIKIHIEKNIPLMSGLGGESTDAAGTLLALNKMYNTKLTKEELCRIGLEIGCDIPYSIKGGTKEVKGRGEILKPYPIKYKYFLVIAPEYGNSTKEMFQKYDTLNKYKHKNINIGYNDFEKVLDKTSLSIINTLRKNNYKASLTGSGSSIIGIFKDKKDLENSYNIIKNKYPNVRLFKTKYVKKITLE